MKNFLLAAFSVVTASASMGASAAAHYVPGVEGMQAASVPPPGMYYLGYLVNYNIDDLQAPGSSDSLPGSNMSGTVSALANRLVYVTGTKFLGADYGMETIVPVVRKSLNFAGESSTGVGDIYLGPLVLGWHGRNWDAVAAAGMWLDTGNSDSPSKPGNGYKSTMLTGGGTYYFDAAKSWTGSALVRYELNSKNDHGFELGDQVTMEWGIGKSVGPVQVGLVGYDQWQSTKDSGTGASNHKSSRHAIGAEVVYPLMKEAGVMLKAAYYDEYYAKAGTNPETKGSTLRFSFVKAF